MQGITTTVALFPIVGVALLGWFWFNPETYMEGWNVSGESSLTAVGMTLNFTLWAFIGVESASVSTAVVKNPAKNVPIATVVGVLLAAVCYVLSSSAIMGIIPNKELVSSSAPFSQAVSIALGSTAGKSLPSARRWAVWGLWPVGRFWSDKRLRRRPKTVCLPAFLPASTAAAFLPPVWRSLPAS